MNPYQNLDPNAFWRTAIAEKSMFDISGLWQPKFEIQSGDAVATYGSCFAQHIGRSLRERGYSWLITETAPADCPVEVAREYNYEIFSSRTGNIYTTSLLLQWTRWAIDPTSIPDVTWSKDGRFIDPFRPQIEPAGFATIDELKRSRLQAVDSYRASLMQAKYFVFTLGLTESWVNAVQGYEYPMCPGTIAGEYIAGEHVFHNQEFEQVKSKLASAIADIRSINPEMLFILTVSPVPLTATASGKHVLVATMQSKSVLRAVAGQMSDSHDYIDYFPSYEIINGTPFGGIFFEANKRSVHRQGVDFVMNTFFAPLEAKSKQHRRAASSSPLRVNPSKSSDAEVCEEALLDAFGARK